MRKESSEVQRPTSNLQRIFNLPGESSMMGAKNPQEVKNYQNNPSSNGYLYNKRTKAKKKTCVIKEIHIIDVCYQHVWTHLLRCITTSPGCIKIGRSIDGITVTRPLTLNQHDEVNSHLGRFRFSGRGIRRFHPIRIPSSGSQ